MHTFQIFLDTVITNWEITVLFFLIAMLYASVGFGGGSSYLAVLALTSLAFTQIRATALLCNIVVVSGGSYIYIKNYVEGGEIFRWPVVWGLRSHTLVCASPSATYA